MSTAITKPAEQAIEVQPPTPMRLIELAVEKGADANQLAILMDLQIKWEANEARKRFEEAMQLFKENAPIIEKTKHVQFANRDGNKTDYWHAELPGITKTIGEALLKVGITHSWKTSDANGRTTVTCVLKGFGHTEEAATLSGPADTSGGKNNIQAIGSTVTYLQRYTLLAACGIAATNNDDDGKTEGLPEDTITDYCVQMQDDTDLKELQAHFKECWEKAKNANDLSAKSRFQKVYEGRKRELLAEKRGGQ